MVWLYLGLEYISSILFSFVSSISSCLASLCLEQREISVERHVLKSKVLHLVWVIVLIRLHKVEVQGHSRGGRQFFNFGFLTHWWFLLVENVKIDGVVLDV